MNFPKEELVNMVFILGECRRNISSAIQLYRDRYPNNRVPQRSTLRKLLQRFTHSGNVAYQKKVYRNRSVLTEEFELNMLCAVYENRHVSQRQISRNFGISKTTVQRVLKKHNFHGYHMTTNQELHGRDFQNRIEFCNFITERELREVNFVSKILFSDEASFKSNGSVNKFNAHLYATENPKWMRTIDNQRLWTLNVWGGILDNYVIGPYFFDEYLNQNNYLEFLQNELPILLENVNLRLRNQIIFQQDGAPPHSARNVTQYLNLTFEEWIGRNGPIKWPARSPDLTPLDFVLCGYVKDKVYKDVPTTIEDMKNRITIAFSSITRTMLHAVTTNFIYRMQKCTDVDGQTFEHLL